MVRLGNSTLNVGGDAAISVCCTQQQHECNKRQRWRCQCECRNQELKGISQNNPSAQLNVKGDGSVTGTISNSNTVTANSAEGNATATGSSAGGDQFVDLQSLIVNGVGNDSQVANTTNTTAESTAGEATPSYRRQLGWLKNVQPAGRRSQQSATNSSSSIVEHIVHTCNCHGGSVVISRATSLWITASFVLV